MQVEDGPAYHVVNGALAQDNASPRWLGTGRTVYNNKGNPVKQYEPFFSFTSDYESDAQLVKWGVTPILHYEDIWRIKAGE